jgi:hypothetical protein
MKELWKIQHFNYFLTFVWIEVRSISTGIEWSTLLKLFESQAGMGNKAVFLFCISVTNFVCSNTGRSLHHINPNIIDWDFLFGSFYHVYNRSINFSTIWQLSPLPVTELQI